MKIKIAGLITFILFVSASSVFAQRLSSAGISKVGTTVGQFLKINVSARAVGMGGSFIAIANDVSAIYSNPAGLARINGYEAMFTHTNWIGDTQYDFGAVSFNMGSAGTMGIMVSSFSSGDMAVTTVENPEGTGELFNTQDVLIGLSYARNLTDNFTIGFNGKYIYQKLWHMSASTMALDVGLLFNTPFWGVQLGASIRNFGANMQLSGRDTKFARDPDSRNVGNVDVVNGEYEMLHYPLPLYFQVGLSKTIQMNEKNSLTVAFDAVTPNDNFESVNAGFEYAWNGSVFLRGGYKSLFQQDSEEGVTAGIGFNLRMEGTTKIQIDYAYAGYGRFDNVQRFSLLMHF